MRLRVLAAMSGGVDSATAAARAVDAGHEVTGVHLALSQNPQSYRTGARGCCTLEDARDALLRSNEELQRSNRRLDLERSAIGLHGGEQPHQARRDQPEFQLRRTRQQSGNAADSYRRNAEAEQRLQACGATPGARRLARQSQG